MSKRLGETLVEAGRLTEAELHKALTSQLVFGGHLGTSLLELGFIDEETLGRTLSRIFAVPCAGQEQLGSIPYAVVRCLPVRLVEKHKVIPLRLDVRTLELAMIDPKNLAAIDEISFVTGYRIVPWVAPEVRILQAMEKYYSLQRPQRFLWLAEEVNRRSAARPQQAASPSHPGTATARAAERSQVAMIGGGQPPPSIRSSSESSVDHWEKYGYGRSWQDVAEVLEDANRRESTGGDDSRNDDEDTRPHPRVTVATPAPLAVDSPRNQPLTLLEASRRLADSGSVEEVVTATLDFAGARIHRVIFFVTKGDRAVGWAGREAARPLGRVESVSLPISGGASILGVAGAGRPCYMGPPPPGDQGAGLYDRLGIHPPRTILVAPIQVTGRVAAYLYGDGGDAGAFSVDLPTVLTLCARAGLALQILLLRNKILAS